MSEEAEVAETPEVAPIEAPADKDSLLDDAAPVLADGEWFQSDGIKGTGDKPEWYLSDKYGSVNEQAKGYSELQKKFGAMTGTPKDGYALPEGVDKDDALAVEFITLATDMGMNQKGFDKGFELLSAQMGVNEEVNQENELTKLGDNAGQRIKAVENALKFKAGDGYNDLKDMITTADGVILAEKLIKTFAPTKLPMDGGENPTGVTWADIESLMFERNSDGNLKRSVDREHESKIQRMMKEFGGDKPNIVTVS